MADEAEAGVTLYACRHCGIETASEIRPLKCHACKRVFGFDEVWTVLDETLNRALEQWNTEVVLTKWFPEKHPLS